ncbi:MAG: C1 family peptidase [Bacteroidales bacterium]|nr:C1 family peptidase [Bacteroidales bacterium]MCF8454649.1 C1 family peptidase [Bacteroidales bacterium]
MVLPGWGQKDKKKEDKEKNKAYQIENQIELPATSVKNQQRAGTCWSYATTSFIESELMRMDKGEYDLSEIYFARYAYLTKAELYVRKQGKGNFSQGGQAHDVMNVIRQHGFVPESVYPGNTYGKEHNHTEIENIMQGMLDGVLKSKRSGLTSKWLPSIDAVLSIYFGPAPEQFEMDGKSMSPKSFTDRHLNFNPDDYIEITSYSHHPFYTKFNLEVPDNWSSDLYYNIPLDELIDIMDYAIKQGFTVCWDGDVSEREFNHKKGLAIVPEKEWADKDDDEKEALFDKYEPERTISQEYRQEKFDNLVSTDDHLMHIVGISMDKNKNKYYLTKNSWAADSNDFGGKLNMSESYCRLHTVAIMVHKKAIPKEIAGKMGLK